MKYYLLLIVFLVAFSTGSAQSTAKGGIAVFPNPATEYITVSESIEGIQEVAIYNLVGKRVKEFEYVRGEQYSVADLPKGMYLVQLIDRNKRTVKTQKVDKR